MTRMTIGLSLLGIDAAVACELPPSEESCLSSGEFASMPKSVNVSKSSPSLGKRQISKYHLATLLHRYPVCLCFEAH